MDNFIDIRHVFPSKENWDSYEGLPTTEAALRVLRNIKLSPLISGGVCIDIFTADGKEVSIDVSETGEFKAMMIDDV